MARDRAVQAEAGQAVNPLPIGGEATGDRPQRGAALVDRGHGRTVPQIGPPEPVAWLGQHTTNLG